MDERQEHIQWLEEHLALLQSKRYKHSSEKYNALQGCLFDKSELDAAIHDIQGKLDQAKEANAESSTLNKLLITDTANRPRRKPLPDHLRCVHIDIDVDDEEKNKWVMTGSRLAGRRANS